ncbi:MAG: stage V sporulation protein AC [Ruminococcus sp.]|nr:stage V sporulation protein AC [Ruminococcus sp.]
MVTAKEYAKLVEQKAPKSKTALNCVRAFLIGGGICAAGQGIFELFKQWGLDELASRTATSVTLIFIGVLITALGLYDKLARKAGAGTLVPITGFANAVSAPAIEFRTEGFVTGIGAKMFSIAGSVLVYGVSASVIYGAVLWVMGMFGVTLY